MGRTRAPAAARGQPAGPSSTPLFPPSPVTWVDGVEYLYENRWDARVPKEVLKALRPVAGASACDGPPRSALVMAGRINDPQHPAFGQCGLFAAKKLLPGQFVLDYRGVVTRSEHESKTSDYTLAFVEDGPELLTLDAESAGNEARFINDFRGCPPHQPGVPSRANVRFQARTDARGVRHMGVYVLNGVTVARGQELLLSYGKGYWIARGLLRAEAQSQECHPAAAALAEQVADLSLGASRELVPSEARQQL